MVFTHGDIWKRGKPVWAGLKMDDGRSATVRCPVCDELFSLTGHAILADGTVTADGTGSVRCPIKGCTFHEMVKLEGWTECPVPGL